MHILEELLHRRCKDWKQSIGRSHPQLLPEFFKGKSFQAGAAAMAELLPVIKQLHGYLYPRSNQHAFWDLPYDNDAARRYKMTLDPPDHLRGMMLYRVAWKTLGGSANNNAVLQQIFGLEGGGQTAGYDKKRPLLLDRFGMSKEKMGNAVKECRPLIPETRPPGGMVHVLNQEVASLTEEERLWFGRRWFGNDVGELPTILDDSMDHVSHGLLEYL